MKPFFLSLVVLLFVCTPLKAKIKLPALVGDHMVLQQNAEINIWGWADPGEAITITPGWQSEKVSTSANTEGNWKVTVATPAAGGPYEIVLEGKNKITLSDVLLGEVWICSGQSNMHMPVGKYEDSWKTGVMNYEKEVKEADYPQIRLFTVALKTSDSLQNDVEGNWQACSPETVYGFSAAGYFFGREIHQTQNVPVGLITSAWGGTPAEAWTKREVLESDPDFVPILDRYEEKYDKYQAELTKYQAQSRKAGPANTRPEKPKPPQYSKAPSLIYNAMVYPLLNYTVRGVVWYQGESNAERAHQYRKLFPAMIKNWRNDWKQGDFPFYFVQIAPHRGQNPEIREAQLLSMKSVPNTGMVVLTDAGNAQNIHPLNKQVVGKRLALWARAQTYGEKGLVYSGPIFTHMKKEGEKIRLYFDYTGSGLVCKGDSLTHFTIAEKNGEFLPAKAEIENNTIVVSNPEIKNPAAVRFGWENVPEHNLFNKEGLPASPFRTDNRPEATYGKQ
ncbi:sialate O-acetylesterase [Sinomicrobium kalidii]|uniref:sialate O-acetylesterase n=1 Tax=Sinomicrobium kalidii TaxID=2900738 RepID=UPI001E40A5A9|nr:sialate O-acetylesterase [Sinomicrobium kalidii]UGU18202.1 sialate O-acetylesterase [Sinomicrobium kalidii]